MQDTTVKSTGSYERHNDLTSIATDITEAEAFLYLSTGINYLEHVTYGEL